jgi:hypothetical protein
MSNILSSFLVLDYCKYWETKDCLESIKKHALFPHKTVLLDNGGNREYPFDFFKEGLCDVFITKKDGGGGGFGQTDLFRWCDTPYAYFVQNDQKLIRDINEETNNKFIELLNNGYNCVDLNGDQSRRGVWTDRAHFIDVKFFNSLVPNLGGGGPGENHHLPWNERGLQDIFKEKMYQIAHVGPLYFEDCGKLSIRKNPDGSVWEIRPDTKGVRLVKGPVKEKYIFPEFTDAEWQQILDSQKWEEWDIPEELKQHSFHVWN